MTYDEDVQAVQEYIQACAKLLRIKASAVGCLEIAEKYMAKYSGSRAAIMVQLTPLSLHGYIHDVMSEDIRTAEEVREELAMSTRQIPLELHPENHLDSCSCMTCIPEADSPEDIARAKQ